MPDNSTSGDGLARIAIVSTPRTGNTWMRGLLARIYDLVEMAVHSPEEIDWPALPPRCVVQIHWRRQEPFVSLLRDHGFRVVVLARHPLDVFLSALNYTQYVHSREGCTDGPDCGPCSILGATPRSEAFIRYCCSRSPNSLLAFTREWWPAPGVSRVRYEDMVERPVETLEGVVTSIGLEPLRSIAETVEIFDIDRMRARQHTWHYHYWQGRPGHWQTLIPAREARHIAAVQADAFGLLGYGCEPDEGLTDIQADLSWAQLQLQSARKHLRIEREKHRVTREGLDEATRTVAETAERLEVTHAELNRVWERFARADEERFHLANELAEARPRLASIDGLGPRSIGIARQIHRFSNRHPKLRSALRRVAKAARLAG